MSVDSQPWLAPSALTPGSHVRAIAPSSPFDRERFEAGVARLRTRYRVTYAPDLFERQGYLAGTDARRAAELNDALNDPSVDAIVAVRGGCGATRLLDRIDVERVRATRKLLVGFSDVTALHAVWSRAKVRSLHATMVERLAEVDESLWHQWIACVEGSLPTPLTGLDVLRGGSARGPLIGGNLSLVVALVGTPYAFDFDRSVVFLEDVGERPYAIDRMLTTLRLNGAWQRAAGVLLGGFTDCQPGPDGRTAEDVLREHFSEVAIPVLSGVSAGHLDANVALAFGAPVCLDEADATVHFEQPGFIAKGEEPC